MNDGELPDFTILADRGVVTIDIPVGPGDISVRIMPPYGGTLVAPLKYIFNNFNN